MVKTYYKPPSQRQLQVSREIRVALCESFARHEYYHPLLESSIITVPEVRISPDLRIATAFVSVSCGSVKREVLDILKNFSQEIRANIAKKLRLRFIPEINFLEDEAQENASKIEKILEKVIGSNIEKI